MNKLVISGAAACAALAAVAAVGPAGATTGPMAFEPISGSAYDQASTTWTEPYVVPDGFTQHKVADETDLDLYAGQDDLSDMNTVNETGRQAGRYLYRTHEVGENAGVAVVDLRTGEAKVLVQDPSWSRIDGITWTPWGTLLVGEERTGGEVHEIFLDKSDPSTVDRVEDRPQLGVQSHEGIGVASDGSVFVIDELNGGSIYRFVPSRRGDLSQGRLYALKLDGLSDAEQKWSSATFEDKVGSFTWVPLDMDRATVDGRAAADDVDATEFGRPEDVQVIGRTVYVANTSEDRVVAIDLARNTLATFVLPGSNVPAEDQDAKVTGFHSPDNLAKGPDGNLWIVEDNDFSDIWATTPDRDGDGLADSVELFASLKDQNAETSGIYFGKDPRSVFVNIQHPGKELADGTWVISRR
jgi:secreted PhoX family phosphatase